MTHHVSIAVLSLSITEDWSRKIAPNCKPIRCRTKWNGRVITSISPLFRQFVCFYFTHSLLPCDISFVLSDCCDFFGFGIAKLKTQLLRLTGKVVIEIKNYGRCLPIGQGQQMKKSKKSDERRSEEKEYFEFSHFISCVIVLKFSKKIQQNTLRPTVVIR